MRPPILYLTVVFAAGLAVALHGVELRVAAWCVLVGALLLCRTAPLAAALALMLVAGTLWGTAALREQRATCVGQWTRPGVTRAVTIQLSDPVAVTGGVTEGLVRGGGCGGALTIRWPDGHAAHGGTTWVVAGRFLGDVARGLLVARRVRELDAVPRGRGALRDRIADRSRRLFGARAPLVDALVIARRAELDGNVIPARGSRICSRSRVCMSPSSPLG